MTNLEKYNAIFTEVFGASVEQLGDNFSKKTVSEWDSVHQLNIISLLEETFDLMLDPEDIMACTSYNAGKEILAKNKVELQYFHPYMARWTIKNVRLAGVSARMPKNVVKTADIPLFTPEEAAVFDNTVGI